MPIGVSFEKHASVAVYELHEEHEQRGEAENRKEEQRSLTRRVSAFQSARNCALCTIGSEGCMYVEHGSTRRS